MLGMLLTGCSKDDDNETPGLPPLPDPDDICSAMDNIEFMAFCYENFDVNKDGKVSPQEAEAVHTIKFEQGLNGSLKGIERFSNLEVLDCESYYWASGTWYYTFSFSELNLQHNVKLKELWLHTCPNVEYINLQNNIMLNKLSIHDCDKLQTLILPTTLGEFSMGDCEWLQNIKCYAENPPQCSISDFSFRDCKVYVPATSLEIYKKTTTWSQFEILPLD